MAVQLLGISAAEVTHLMPEIEAFAEIGYYIDQPVRSTPVAAGASCCSYSV